MPVISFTMLRILLLFPLLALAQSSGYNYFDFVRMWSPNACYQRGTPCKHIPPQIRTWTIHGLWPSEDASHYPADCAGDFTTCKFNSSSIADLAPALHVQWPTDFKGGDTKFWSHEYCKHGTCATDIYPRERDYFAGALSLQRAMSLDTALAKADIEPDLNHTFTFEQLDAALARSFGPGRAVYWCRFVKEGGVSKQLMYQVSSCVDRKGKVVDCPGSKAHSCVREQPLYLLPWSVLK